MRLVSETIALQRRYSARFWWAEDATLGRRTRRPEVERARKMLAAAPDKPANGAEKTSDASASRTTIRLVILSDTHGKHWTLPPLPMGDVLIHCGDIANKGSLDDIRSFARYLAQQPHRWKICIEGNHDRDLQSPGRVDLARELSGVATVLKDQTVIVSDGRLRIHGCSWATCENDAYEHLLGGGAPTPDVLLTHYPPAINTGLARHLPEAICRNLPADGSPTLRKLVERKRIPLHFFGHLHLSRGVAKSEASTFINASTLDGTGAVIVDYDPQRRSVERVDCRRGHEQQSVAAPDPHPWVRAWDARVQPVRQGACKASS